MSEKNKQIGLITAAFIGLLLFLPAVAFAADFDDILFEIGRFINTLTPIVVAIAVLFFFWGLANYILKTDDPEGRVGARSMMIWGVIILFVMISVFGLIKLLEQTFDLQDGDIKVPVIKQIEDTSRFGPS